MASVIVLPIVVFVSCSLTEGQQSKRAPGSALKIEPHME
jgi:hypothetical protein